MGKHILGFTDAEMNDRYYYAVGVFESFADQWMIFTRAR